MNEDALFMHLIQNFPSRRGQNITFEKLGGPSKNDTANLLDTLGNILKKHHYKNRKNTLSENGY